MADREVTPQLGLLKSTLLQLDSTFSEKDYGVSSFRDFVEKLAQAGLVTLRQAGRSMLVDLREGEPREAAAPEAAEAVVPAEHPEHAGGGAEPAEPAAGEAADARPQATFADGVNLLRRVLQNPAAISRWPMYIRNVKQILKAAEPSFDERRHGNLIELLRAVQREGLVRLERDRQGVLRVFQGQQARPHMQGIATAPIEMAEPVDAGEIETEPAEREQATPADDTPSVQTGETTEPAEALAPDVEPGPETGAKPRRRRKTADGAAPKTKSTAARKPRARTATARKKKQDIEKAKDTE
jgi:hypothetical protein